MTRTPIRLPDEEFDYHYRENLMYELETFPKRYRQVGIWIGLRPEHYLNAAAVETLSRVISDGLTAADAATDGFGWDRWRATTVPAICALFEGPCPEIMSQVPQKGRVHFGMGVDEGWHLRATGATIVAGKFARGPIHAPLYSCRAEFPGDVCDALTHLHAADPHLIVHRYLSSGLDPRLEFETHLSLELIYRVLLACDQDIHVMRESLRACPLQSNSLERTYMDKPEALVTDEERRAHEEEMAKYR